MTDDERISYLPTLKIDMKDAPLVLSIPTNFKPIQVRLRWLKGVEISTNKNEQDKTSIGRISDVHEEIFNPDNFTLKVDADGTFNVFLTSIEVHLPHSIQLIYPDMFKQQDIGLRLLKEVVITSVDGQTLHLVQAPNLKIYNQEYLKVKPMLKCLPSIIH